MAQECHAVISAIDLLKGRHLDSSTIAELVFARNRLERVSLFLVELEEFRPENMISTQLGALFQQAHDGFSEICTHMDQHYTFRMAKALKKIKLENIAERCTTASKSSRSTRGMISKVLKILQPENIAERIKASKPSTSSSRITTMEMVKFVYFLLGYVLVHAPLPSVLFKKLRHLQAFFIVTAHRCIEHESMQYLFTHVEDVAYTGLPLSFFSVTSNNNLDFELLEPIAYTGLQLCFLPDLRQIYKSLLTVSKSSRSKATMNPKYALDFVHALLEDLAEMPLGYDEIHCLSEGLTRLSIFLWDIEYIGTPLKEFSSLQSLVEALAFDAAFVIYSYDEDLLFVLRPKLNHVNVVIELIELLNRQSTMTDPLKDLIDYAWEELIALRTFLMDSLEQCKQKNKITDFLTLIQSVTNEACSVIIYEDFEGFLISR